ncbi:hypothetical protein, partial [Mycobacteroides abscessus]|uniref:hypothetical protein n=2 Tax=Mycobacteroides abscessus TaxID=36809 RepID=UPI000A870154
RWRTHPVATDHSASVSRARTWPCPRMFGPMRNHPLAAPALGDVLKILLLLIAVGDVLAAETRTGQFRNVVVARSEATGGGVRRRATRLFGFEVVISGGRDA